MAAHSTMNERLLTAVKEKRSLDLVNECLKHSSFGLGLGLDWVCFFKILFFLKLRKILTLSNKAGNSALHHAVLNGDFEIVKSLVLHGANVNSYNKFKKTP